MSSLLDPSRTVPVIPGVETAAQLAARTTVHQSVPVVSALAPLFPLSGLERGRVYACAGQAQVSLMLALAAEATQQGAWLAMVNMEHIGFMAAHEHGVALQRTVCLSAPSQQHFAPVVGALVDGFDLVVLWSPRCSQADARRVVSRALASGAVVLVLGEPGVFPIDAHIRTRTLGWRFAGHAQERTVEVHMSGRRAHAGTTLTVQLPGVTGRVHAAAA